MNKLLYSPSLRNTIKAIAVIIMLFVLVNIFA
jgi:hypothetical protein